jgi:hypothetical protein
VDALSAIASYAVTGMEWLLARESLEDRSSFGFFRELTGIETFYFS